MTGNLHHKYKQQTYMVHQTQQIIALTFSEILCRIIKNKPIPKTQQRGKNLLFSSNHTLTILDSPPYVICPRTRRGIHSCITSMVASLRWLESTKLQHTYVSLLFILTQQLIFFSYLNLSTCNSSRGSANAGQFSQGRIIKKKKK